MYTAHNPEEPKGKSWCKCRKRRKLEPDARWQMRCERHNKIRLGESERWRAGLVAHGGSALSGVALALTVVCLLSGCAPFLSAQTPADLILNKYQFSGDSATMIAATEACISTNAAANNGTNLQNCPNAITAAGTAPGSEVLYVITISNSNTATYSSPPVYETVPLGFAWDGVGSLPGLQCASGICPALSIPFSGFSGPTAISPLPSIPYDGVIVIYILGHYNTTGTKTNFVSAVTPDSPALCVGRTNCNSATLVIPNATLLTDLGIAKCVNVGSTCVQNLTTYSSGTPITYTITITNNGPGDIYPGNLIQVADNIANLTPSPSFPVTYSFSGITCSISCTPASTLTGTLGFFSGANSMIATFLPGNPITPELCTKPCSADGAADPRSVIPA